MQMKTISTGNLPLTFSGMMFLLLFLAVFPSENTSAQTVFLYGKITDADTREVLPGVNIVADGHGGTISDGQGNYRLKLPPGPHVIRFSFVGYATQIKNIRATPGERLLLNIGLKQETVNLNTAVVSAGKFRQKLSSITLSMAVIKPDFIENTNTINLGNAINKIPGVEILDGQASIRGGGGYSYGAGSRVMVMVDGLPILTADADQVKWNFLPIENIQQVEIVKGAASVLYGSSALDGVINIRTGWPGLRPETKVTAYGGLYDRPQRKEMAWWWQGLPLLAGFRFLHSRKMGNTDLVLGADALTNEGYRQDNFEKHLRFNFKLRQRNKKTKGLTYGLNANMQWQNTSDFFIWQDADSGAFLQVPGTTSPMKGFRFHADPWISYFGNHQDNHSLRTRFFQVSNRFDTSPDKNSASEMYYAEYRYHRKFQKHLELNAGLSGLFGNTHAALYGNHTNSTIALFLQAGWRWSPRLLTTAGFRWEDDRMDRTDHASAPVFRAGMNYRLAPYTFLRASFGQGFRYPSVAEKYTATTLGSLRVFPNPDLNPERSWSSEIGLKQGFKINSWKGFIDVAAFWNEYSDMIEYTFGIYKPDSVSIPSINDLGFKALNIGRARIRGLELNIRGAGKIANHLILTAYAGYTYKNPEDLSLPDTVSNNILKYRYRHTAKGDLSFRYKRFETGCTVIYHSFMERIDKVFEEPILGIEIFKGLKAYRQAHNKGSVVLDVRVAVRLPKNIRLSLLINNLANTETMGRPGDIRPPRNFQLQCRWNISSIRQNR